MVYGRGGSRWIRSRGGFQAVEDTVVGRREVKRGGSVGGCEVGKGTAGGGWLSGGNRGMLQVLLGMESG